MTSDLIGTNYNCTEVDANGNFIGSLSYTSSTNTLAIQGAVFVDGSISATQDLNVTGNGTLYLNGNFSGGPNKQWTNTATPTAVHGRDDQPGRQQPPRSIPVTGTTT